MRTEIVIESLYDGTEGMLVIPPFEVSPVVVPDGWFDLGEKKVAA